MDAQFSWDGVYWGGELVKGLLSLLKVIRIIICNADVAIKKGFPYHYLDFAVLCSNCISVYIKYFKLGIKSSWRNDYIILFDYWGPCFGCKRMQLNSAVIDFLLRILLLLKMHCIWQVVFTIWCFPISSILQVKCSSSATMYCSKPAFEKVKNNACRRNNSSKREITTNFFYKPLSRNGS